MRDRGAPDAALQRELLEGPEHTPCALPARARLGPGQGTLICRRLVPLVLAAVLAACCANVKQECPAAPVALTGPDEGEFERALDLLVGGERAEARVIFERLVKEGEPPGLRPRAYFCIGIIRLYEMEDPGDMAAVKKYFDDYRQTYPLGPDQENVSSISRWLGVCISQGEKDQERIQALSRRLKDQEQLINTLKEKIQQLEQIHQEVEQERQSM